MRVTLYYPKARRGYRYARGLRRIAGADRRVEHIGCE